MSKDYVKRQYKVIGITVALIGIVIALVFLSRLFVNKTQSFNGRKTIYVATPDGVGGPCMYPVYDKLKELNDVCLDSNSIPKLYVNDAIKRGIEDVTATGKAIYSIDADVHSTVQNIAVGNPSANRTVPYTVVYIDKVYDVAEYKVVTN